MKVIWLFSLASTLAASPASAEVILQQNIMRCESHLGYQRHCQIPEGIELLPKQTIESEFYVSYTLTCDRKYPAPQPSRMQLLLESRDFLTLNYKDAQNMAKVGTGYGPLTLIDTFPKELSFRTFNDCQLIFSDAKAIPSARVRSVWETELQGAKALLESKEALVGSLEKVALLMPAYQFFQNLVASLDADLRQNAEVLQLIQALSSCNIGEDCDLLYKLSSDMSNGLTPEERLLVMQLRSLLAELPAKDDPLVLQSLLSEASVGTLQKLAEDVAFYEDAEAQIKQTQLEIEELRGQITSLRARLEGAKLP